MAIIMENICFDAKKTANFLNNNVTLETFNETLETNKIYSATFNSDVVFNLPTNIDTTIHNQIKIYATFNSVVSVTWGTNYFYHGEIPNIDVGSYEIFFDYGFNHWTCGVLKVGSV